MPLPVLRLLLSAFPLLLVHAQLNAATDPQEIAPLYTKYKDGKLQEVYLTGQRLLSADPENAELNQILGRVLVEIGKSREATPYLEKAVANDKDRGWISAWALCYLGQARFYSDDYEGARKALNESIALQAGESVTRTAQRFQLLIAQAPYFQNWLTKETAHFRFHLQPSLSAEELQAYTEAHERLFSRVAEALGGVQPPKKIDLIVWNNRLEPMERFQLSVNQADPVKAVVYCARSHGPSLETTYVIAHYAVSGERGDTTGFVSTGLAVYLEDKRKSDEETLKAYLYSRQIDRISTTDVWNRWKKYPEAYSHPLAGAFVRALIERFGMEKFKKLLARQTYEDARYLYGDALDELIKDFDARFGTAASSTVKQDKS